MIQFKLALCLCAFLFVFASCAKTNQTTTPATASPSPEASPPAVKGESANWRVTVKEVVKEPKRPPSDQYVPPELRNNQTIFGADLDQIKVTVTIEYLGAPGKVLAPQAAVVDTKGRRFEIITLGTEADPGFKQSKVGENDLENEMKRLEPLMDWLFSAAPTRGRKPKIQSRDLFTGERYLVNYNFEDPKSENLKLAFADVPPILLPPAKAPKSSD